MTRALATVVIAVLVASCGFGSHTQSVHFAKLAFDMPDGWQAADTSHRGVAISTWTPDDNDRKESITVIRSESGSVVAKAGTETLERLLQSAQSGLGGAKVSRVSPLTTAKGLVGAMISADYTPSGLRRSYHRVHVVLIDDGTLVHVLYTAADPDEGTFAGVISSLHHEES